ncbi:hypothetical protein PHYC_02176 [Phycisphaerales bacterium]|nr:hypothetical protein PHYC_02176 [Phycisphaerales bacterium]
MSAPPPRPFSGLTPAVIGAAVLWIALVVTAALVGRYSGHQVRVCLFNRVTGYPCATCGGTRAAAQLAHLNLPAAIAFNPLVTVLILGLPPYIVWRSTRGRAWQGLSARGYRIAAWTLVVSVAANWAYVLLHERAIDHVGPAQDLAPTQRP